LRWYSIKPVCEGDFTAISGWLSKNVVLTKINKVKSKKKMLMETKSGIQLKYDEPLLAE
jgi:hypothetical protein